MSQILVTGGSGGIGAALVKRLAAEGHEVMFTFCSSAERAEALARATGARPLHYDQRLPESVRALAAQIGDRRLDALVNNGAERPRRQLALKVDAEEFLAYQMAALRGVFELSTAFAAAARARQATGAIVNVLTAYTRGLPPAKLSAYVTSKYALLGMTRSLAVEFIRYGIRVNAVSPGVTRTDFVGDLPERFIEQLAAGLPMERLASAEEVAAVIGFLLSPAAAYVSGVNLPVAGGAVC